MKNFKSSFALQRLLVFIKLGRWINPTVKVVTTFIEYIAIDH